MTIALQGPGVDRPRWLALGLIGVLVAAGFLYGWRAAGNLEIYYAAAVRSMATSWHNFFFASFDPAGTISVDKLPGAFWVQAAFVRLFGPRPWAFVAPQVLEGVGSVGLMFRIVARLAGWAAGLMAAIVLTVSPAVVALDRGNISDTLMILLLLAAADATLTATERGRWRWIVAAGIWIGLAFQAKMLEAWVVAIAIAALYLVSGPGSRVARLVRTAAMAGVAVVVSLVWMIVVELWPAGSRPYVDGSQHDSIFAQVFAYNGFGRIDAATPNQILSQTIDGGLLDTRGSSIGRLLSGSFGLDAAWLVPLAVVCWGGIIWTHRSSGRRHPAVAAAVLWGVWLAVLLVVFSVSTSINSYYLAALAPPTAGLVATGVTLAWRERCSRRVRGLAAIAVAVTAGYAIWLLPRSGQGLPAGLWVILAVLAVGAVAAAAAGHSAYLVAGFAVCLLAPAIASVSLVVKTFGPFDTPFESVAAAARSRALADVAALVRPDVPRLEKAAGTVALAATQSAALAAPFIFDTGQELLPIGGFDSSIPEPTLTALQNDLRSGAVHLVIQASTVTDPRLQWVQEHCDRLIAANPNAKDVQFDVYYCL